MPSADDVVKKFHGDDALKVSTLQKLLDIEQPLTVMDPPKLFNGSGSMAAAFTKRSDDWRAALRERPEGEVRREREGERQAVLWWLKDGLRRDAYDADRLPLPVSLAEQPVTAEYRHDDGTVKIQ